MSTLGRKHACNRALMKETTTTTAIANSTVTSSYFFSRDGPKLKSCCGMASSGAVGRQTALEKRYFEPTITELYNFERPSFEKQTASRIQGVSFSFKVPNTCYMKKGELIISSVKRNYSDTDLKPPVRTIVRSGSSSDLLEKAVLGRTKTMLISKLASDGNSAQDSSSKKDSNISDCILKSDLRSSCSSNLKKRKVEGKADAEPPIKLKKKVDSKKRGNEAAGNGNKCFPRVICSSRLSAMLNRNSEWEKLAMKSRSIYLKHRSQKMLKDRLEKYCVMAQKSHTCNSERLDAKKANQTPLAPYSTFKEVLLKSNQDLFDFCSSNLNKKKVEQSKTSCGNSEMLVEKNTPSGKNLSHEISELGSEDAKKIPYSSLTEISPLIATNGNSQEIMSNKSDVKQLSLTNDTKDATEIEVTKEVESLVKKALLQTAASSYFRTNQDLRKSVSDSIQKGGDFDMINDDAKLRKVWALVAEESSLTNSLNDVSAKISKIKADLCALSNESFQITKRLDEVRFLKNQLLSDSYRKFYPNFQP